MACHRRGGGDMMRRSQNPACCTRRPTSRTATWRSSSPARAPKRRSSAGCPQDLSLETFPVGACSRTMFGKAEIVLFRTEEDTFRVGVLALVWRFRVRAARPRVLRTRRIELMTLYGGRSPATSASSSGLYRGSDHVASSATRRWSFKSHQKRPPQVLPPVEHRLLLNKAEHDGEGAGAGRLPAGRSHLVATP
jgi:hypothetical protein